MTLIDEQRTDTLGQLVPRIWVFVWLGLGLLIPGVLIPNPMVSLGFTISSTTLFALALVIIGMNRRYLASARHFHDSLDVFVHNDNAPTFFVNDEGEISYGNHAATERFGNVEKKSLVMVLSSYTANPVNVIFRLQNTARLKKSAHEDIVTNNGHMRLSTHHIGPKGFVWRLEDLVEQDMPGADSAKVSAMPTLIANKDGKILHANRAMNTLCGGVLSHLDRIFCDLPLRSGAVHRIISQNGPLDVRVMENARDIESREGAQPEGRREIFLWPAGADSGATGEHLFDDLPVALLRLSESGVILDANRQARKLLGSPARNLKLGEVVKGLGRPIGDWLRDAVEKRGNQKAEIVQAIEKTNEDFLQISISRVVEAGRVNLIAVVNDATELKTLEAQFVQSQKMQAIGQLAGGVAHDFNNLLTAISGYCDLLLLRHDEGDPDFGDLTQISQNANRAASLVSQLLAFSRKQNLQPETLDVPETLSELSHLLNRLLGEKVKLEVTNGEGLLPIRADKRQLEQVLMNLVVNARDAMPDGGKVLLETETLVLEHDLSRESATIAAGKYLSIKVTDTGTGIRKDCQSKIFEPFYTTKKTGEGTGLGLSMVYGIIKQTGGFIFVNSAVGQGTTFEIVLPACDASKSGVKPDENADASAHMKPTKKRHAPIKEEGVILLVEDEAPVRAFAARALSMRGYTVLEACDADEALGLLKDGNLKVDVFVTDVIMPGKDGPTWVREALEMRPDVKVVFVSGYAEESFADQQAEIVNSVFLPKPFSLSDLTEKVREQIAA